MKKFLLALALLLTPGLALAQQQVTPAPDCVFAADYNGTTAQRFPAAQTPGGTIGFDNRNLGCTTWHLYYTVTGYSAVSVELDNAPDSNGQPGSWVVWPSIDIASNTLPMTTATQDQITAYEFYPWVSINVNSVTGNGRILLKAYGWRPGPLQDANVAPNSVTINGTTVVGGTVTVVGQTAGAADPCMSSGIVKSSVAISIAAAGTTQLVAPSGASSVYVCGGSFTIAPSGTAADSLQFITGTGATCGGSTVTKTGTFGSGDLTTTTGPLAVTLPATGTVFSAAGSSGVCAVAAGTTVNIQGIITYVQQ